MIRSSTSASGRGNVADATVAGARVSGVTVAGVVLAGGRSSRMGRDKASLVFDGTTLLQRTAEALAHVADEIVVVRAPDQQLPALDLDVPVIEAEDPVEGEGPLIGIAAGLRATSTDVAIVVAVDMPFLQPPLLRLLAERVKAGARWALPIAEGRPQPLCSAFATDAVEILERHIAAGDRAPMAAAGDLEVERIEPEVWRAADAAGRSFLNVNTPEEFEAAQRLLDEA
jgi:molybdopterin-guanine dinucleotide biosynthesis protein A